VRGVIQGDSRPRDFIPRLVDLFMAGRMPLDRLITRYDFAEVNRRRLHLGRCDKAGAAVTAVKNGTAFLKPIDETGSVHCKRQIMRRC
jgi:Zn-dependent alcohol dehydrogenase